MTLDLIATNVFSVPVLALALGLSAAAIKADLRLPDAAYQAISIYLLLAIGLKGGVALREADLAEVAAPVAVAIILGVTIPILAFFGLAVPHQTGPCRSRRTGGPLRLHIFGHLHCRPGVSRIAERVL